MRHVLDRKRELQTRSAPSPLVGEGWGGGWRGEISVARPRKESHDPHKGGGEHTECVAREELNSPREQSPRAEGETLMLTRRRLLAASAAWLGAMRLARAQDWPQRSVRMIVPFGPGGGADIIGRIVAQSLQEKRGQPVVIETRPGAAGTLGNEAVARAEKDGYTLGIMTAGQIIAAVMAKSLRYDTLTAFDPVAQVATAGLIIVTRPDFPA